MSKSFSLERRVAIVTGGASGLGRAVAFKLRLAGARVAILDLNSELGTRAADETGSVFVHCDVTDRDSWREAMTAVSGTFGVPTFVHLNAGVMTRPASAPIDDDPFDWIQRGGYRRVMSVNIDGVTFGLEATVRSMAEAGGGRVVVTASTAAFTPLPFDPFYSMSKHAVVGLVRSIAPVLEARQITINALCPGGLATPLLPDAIANAKPALMSAEEVAEAVLRLSSLESTGGVWAKPTSGAEYLIEAPRLDLI